MNELFNMLKKSVLLELKALVPKPIENSVLPKIEMKTTAVKKVKDFKWPFYKIPRLNNAFVNYLYSIKDENSELFAKSNLMFVVGPEQTGKSWFLRYNLRFFDNHNQLEPKPLIMHWNLETHRNLSFDSFINHFEQLLIKSLAERWRQEDAKKKVFLPVDDILEVFLSKYDPTFVKYNLSKSLKAFANDEEHFTVEGESYSEVLRMADQLRGKVYIDKAYIKEQLQQLIQVLVPNFQNNEVLAALTLLRSLTIAMELEQRPEMYENHYYRNGIETTDFLFDLINYISGFHKIMHYTDLQAEGKNISKIIHSMLVLENFDVLLEKAPQDNRINDFLDHLILRLYDDLRMRTHFPVIIESNNSRFFNRTLFDYLHEREDNSFPAIEISGWINDDQEKALNHMFIGEQIDEARKVLGTHLKDWHTFTNILLSEAKPNFEETIKLNHPLFKMEENMFRNKLNKFFTHPLVGELLDRGELEFHLLDFFERICSKEMEGIIFIGKPLGQVTLMENPMVMALLDVNILYDRKYHSILHFSRRTFITFASNYIREKKSQMDFAEKASFERFKRKHGLYFMQSDLRYSKIVRNKEWYEEPKMELDHEIKEYYPKKQPEDVMQANVYEAFLL